MRAPPVALVVSHPAFNHEAPDFAAASVVVHKGLQRLGKQPLSLVMFINPVADVAGFIQRFNLVERQHAHHLIAQNSKTFSRNRAGAASRFPDMATGFIFAVDRGGPAKRML